MSSQNETGTEDELFDDAVGELTSDINTHLDNARNELPDPDGIWDVDAPNVLGVLNTLRDELDVGDATDELREARKNYVLADRADAFDDDDTLDDELDEVKESIEELEAAREQVSDLTGTIPELKSSLDELTTEDLSEEESNAEAEEQENSEGPAADSGTEETDSETTEEDSSDSESVADESTGTEDAETTSEEDTDVADDADENDEDENVPIHSPPTND